MCTKLQTAGQITVMSESLEVVDIWKSIQGEGPFAGYPAVFIRLAGCNLSCPWCDTDHQTGKQRLTLRQICDEVDAKVGSTRLVVVTGGEPFLQLAISSLFATLAGSYSIQVETNGTIYPAKPMLPRIKVVCSPKPGTEVHGSWRYRVDAWKYVIRVGQVDEDGLPIGTYRPPGGAVIYVQPMDEGNEELNQANQALAVRVCLSTGYVLSLQLHKIVGIK